MKMLELKNMGLIPMTESENKDIQGGVWWIPAALGIGLILSAIHNFADIRQGFSDGWKGKPRYTN